VVEQCVTQARHDADDLVGAWLATVLTLPHRLARSGAHLAAVCGWVV
jgi:hypothetical protein